MTSHNTTERGAGSHVRTAPALFDTPSVTIGYDGGELVVIDDGDENAIWIPVGIADLKLLAFKLLALSAELEGGAR